MDGWMDGLTLYILFNSVSGIRVIMIRMCAMEPCLWIYGWKDFHHQPDWNSGPLLA